MIQSDFLLGCNYWSSDAGIYMWRNYDRQVVERDLSFLCENGVNTIRIFPLWPDFQPLKKLIFCNERVEKDFSFAIRKGENPLLSQKYPDSGLDEHQVGNMRHLLSTAQSKGINVILSIITGWMSGRKLVPEPFESRDLIKDAEVVLFECAFVKDIISAVKDFDNIIAYEPGNETNCLSYDVTEYEATLWAKTIVDTIRLADPTRPVYSGLHNTSCKGKWNLPTMGKIFDMLSPHPYPLFTPYCGQEKLTAMRASMHAAVENSYYTSIAKKPSIIEEIGALGPMMLSDELSADYAETAAFTSYMTGTKGFLWWCAFDQDHLNFAPYDLMDIEVQLGLSTIDYNAKPVLLKLNEMKQVFGKIGNLSSPETDAVCIITNCVDHWASAYGAFMLGVQSGRYIDFCYEEQPLKDSDYYILPSVQGGHSLSKYQWDCLEKKISNGAKLLITYDGGVFRNFEKLTGLKVCGREKISNKVSFDINGKTMSLNRNYKIYLDEAGANVLIKDTEENVLLSENSFGKGKVFFLNLALETTYTQAYYPEKTNLYEIYKTFFNDKPKIFAIHNPKVFVTNHMLAEDKIGVMIYNFDAKCKDLNFVLNSGYVVEHSMFGIVDKNQITMQKNYAYLLLKKLKSNSK